MTPDPDHDLGDTFARLLLTRRSVRGFLPAPVSRSLVERVFTIAQRAPSNCNTQPWTVHIAAADTLHRLREALTRVAMEGGAPSDDFAATTAYHGTYRTRQVDAAKALFAASGVARDDAAGRQRSMLRNFAFFDAPCAAFFFLPEWGGVREAADCGMYAQSVMLALTAHGLASCPQAAPAIHTAVVRRELGVAADFKLLFGLSFGYADPGHPANATETDRAPLVDVVTFHS